MKMTMTSAKLAANRANGQKSQGPRTDAGKQISARNARYTHGLRSRIPHLPSPEDQSVIDRIYSAFHGEYHPITSEETATVREAAVSKWHRDRVARIFDLALAHPNPVDSARALSGLYRHTAAAENRFFRALSALSNLHPCRDVTKEFAPANPASHLNSANDLPERTHHLPVKSTNMPKLISQPTRIEAAGNKPKLIDEYIGRVNSGTSSLSVAHMRSPGGWVEPGQTPEFEEFTVVLKGTLRVEHTGGVIDVQAGQAVVTCQLPGPVSTGTRCRSPLQVQVRTRSSGACPVWARRSRRRAARLTAAARATAGVRRVVVVASPAPRGPVEWAAGRPRVAGRGWVGKVHSCQFSRSPHPSGAPHGPATQFVPDRLVGELGQGNTVRSSPAATSASRTFPSRVCSHSTEDRPPRRAGPRGTDDRARPVLTSLACTSRPRTRCRPASAGHLRHGRDQVSVGGDREAAG